MQVVLNAYGFGLAEKKTTKYELLVGDGPIQYSGFKLLNRQDDNLLPPEEVLDLVPCRS